MGDNPVPTSVLIGCLRPFSTEYNTRLLSPRQTTKASPGDRTHDKVNLTFSCKERYFWNRNLLSPDLAQYDYFDTCTCKFRTTLKLVSYFLI